MRFYKNHHQFYIGIDLHARAFGIFGGRCITRVLVSKNMIVHLLFLILKAETGLGNRTFSNFCSEISVVLFNLRNLEKWFASDCENSTSKLLPDKNSLWLFGELAG